MRDFEKGFLENAGLVVQLHYAEKFVRVDLNPSVINKSLINTALRGAILETLLGFGVSTAFGIEEEKKFCVSVNVGGEWQVVTSGLAFELAGEIVGLLMSGKTVRDVRMEADNVA